MKYNFDETEIKTLREQISKLNRQIEEAVIAQQYKKAYDLKEKEANLEKEISDKKQKFAIPKNERLTV
jgi:hypothetical protein